MKNFKILFLLGIGLFSCESKGDVKSDIDSLRTERTNLDTEVNVLSAKLERNKIEVERINEELHELNILKSGKTPRYILHLEMKQSHFTLSIKEHIKDELNSVDFDIPVDKEFYNSVSVGSEIVDEFRSGSFIMNGSFGDWEITVKSKRII